MLFSNIKMWAVGSIWIAGLFLAACGNKPDGPASGSVQATDSLTVASDTVPVRRPLFYTTVPRDIRIKDYFPFLDTLVRHYDSLTPYALTEHLLIRANPRVIDTLENTDYYSRMAHGEFIYDQRKLVVLHAGDTLQVPDTATANALQKRIAATAIDINIPEYRLRIVEGNDTLYSMKVRVGQNKKRFQEALGRTEDLRTRPGTGTIIRINRAPTWFVDPHTGERFTHTKRDDGRTTLMPMIPWLEPEIDGKKLGQMIHPTTNPESLGKAYSNGCIGCSERDAWRLYYYAPVGTKVVIRYDRKIALPNGDTLTLPDIYQRNK